MGFHAAPSSDCQKSLAEFAPAGANKVKIIFSGGKWVRRQERAARLVKSNPCSVVEFLRWKRRNYARSRVRSPSNASLAER